MTNLTESNLTLGCFSYVTTADKLSFVALQMKLCNLIITVNKEGKKICYWLVLNTLRWNVLSRIFNFRKNYIYICLFRLKGK